MKILSLVVLASISFLFLVNSTVSQGVYDPWVDQDSDGDVDIFDIVPAANAYGTTGDPTKNVTVTNWLFDQYGNLRVTFKEPIVITWEFNLFEDQSVDTYFNTSGLSTLHLYTFNEFNGYAWLNYVCGGIEIRAWESALAPGGHKFTIDIESPIMKIRIENPEAFTQTFNVAVYLVP